MSEAHTDSEFAEELKRYQELLGPLQQMSTDDAAELPGEERDAWQRALECVRSDVSTALEIEEAVSSFARAFWSAPGWVEPPARIAQALLARTQEWPDEERREGLRLAQQMGERALRIDPSNSVARIAMVRVKTAVGDLVQADKAASILPSDDCDAIAARAEVAEARGDRDAALRLSEEQLRRESDGPGQRVARGRIARLHAAGGDLDRAIHTHRENLIQFPDYARGHYDLARCLRDRGEYLEALAEAENAVLLGIDSARGELDEIAAELDQRALVDYRLLLRTAKDEDLFEFASPAAHTTATEGAPA